MKNIAYILFIGLNIISCSQQSVDFLVNKTWIIDSETLPDKLLSFSNSECYFLYFDDGFDINSLKIDTCDWEISNDTLVLDSKTSKEKLLFHIDYVTDDSLLIEMPVEEEYVRKMRFISLTKSKRKISKQELAEKLSNNCFLVKPDNSDYVFNLDFITPDIRINKFDSIHFQIEPWRIQELNGELFLITLYPLGSSALHLKEVRENTLYFESVYREIRPLNFISHIPAINDSTNILLIREWNSIVIKARDSQPPPPMVTVQEYNPGISYEFFSDSTYIYKSGFTRKQGKWILSPSKQYILLDSIEDKTKVIFINYINNDSLSIIHKRHLYPFPYTTGEESLVLNLK